MSARTKARKRALDVLFECEARGLPLGHTLDQRRAAAAADPREPAVTPFTNDVVTGVAEHQTQIDSLLRTLSRDWDLDRMPAVDRNLLRIGVFEILWRDDVPDEVVVSEAVALATDLSTDDSPTFVNGLLGRLAREKHMFRAAGRNGGASAPGGDGGGSVEPGDDAADAIRSADAPGESGTASPE
ncbi:MAG: transcription antitermination factor NusB [Jiangellales bacterium]